MKGGRLSTVHVLGQGKDSTVMVSEGKQSKYCTTEMREKFTVMRSEGRGGDYSQYQ